MRGELYAALHMFKPLVVFSIDRSKAVVRILLVFVWFYGKWRQSLFLYLMVW